MLNCPLDASRKFTVGIIRGNSIFHCLCIILQLFVDFPLNSGDGHVVRNIDFCVIAIINAIKYTFRYFGLVNKCSFILKTGLLKKLCSYVP